MFYLQNFINMRKCVFILLSIFCCSLSASICQKADKDITLLAKPEDKKVCIVQINEDFFLAHTSDIRLINTRIMEYIEMYLPQNPYFKKIKEKYSLISQNIEAVFVIETKEEAKLPTKFIKDKQKK